MAKTVLLITCLLWTINVSVSDESAEKDQLEESDLETAATGKLFDIGGLFNKYPNSGYGRPSYGGSYNPSYGGGGGGYYPSNAGGYYPSVNSGYPNTGYYPQGGSYGGYGGYGGGYGTGYGGYGGGYGGYGGGYGGYNPQTSGGYYPSSSGRYYPSGGTNILGGGYGGYGGYGGNGGLPSYYGYYDSGYVGNRNLGYGYYPGTNRFGFYRNSYSSQPPNVSGYRGYD